MNSLKRFGTSTLYRIHPWVNATRCCMFTLAGFPRCRTCSCNVDCVKSEVYGCSVSSVLECEGVGSKFVVI